MVRTVRESTQRDRKGKVKAMTAAGQVAATAMDDNGIAVSPEEAVDADARAVDVLVGVVGLSHLPDVLGPLAQVVSCFRVHFSKPTTAPGITALSHM